MAIIESKPRVRLRAVLLAAAAALAFVAFAPAEDALAHGSCVNSKTAPVKTSSGRIKGTNSYDCSPNQHFHTKGCARLVREQANGEQTVVGQINCRRAVNAQQSPRVPATAMCDRSGWYRTLGVGFAHNAEGNLVHTAVDYSQASWIDCTTNDLTSTAGVLEDVNTLTAGLLAVN